MAQEAKQPEYTPQASKVEVKLPEWMEHEARIKELNDAAKSGFKSVEKYKQH